jgi:hypothetical protein
MRTRHACSDFRKLPRRAPAIVLVVVSVVIGWLTVLPAQAQPSGLAGVTQAAAKLTPGFNTACKVSGKTQNCAAIRTFLQVGNKMFIGGTFQQILGPNGKPLIDPKTGKPLTGVTNLTVVDTNNKDAVDTSFKHVFNGTILALAVSPDDSRLYVGGQFTTVDGRSDRGLAAFDLTSTGYPLVAAFTVNGAPSVDPGIQNVAHVGQASVRALVVGPSLSGGTAGTLYVGGDFVTALGAPVQQLMAIDLGSGTLITTFTPSFGVDMSLPPCGNLSGQENANTNWVQIWTLALGIDGSGNPRLYVGGHFDSLDGTKQVDLAAIDPATGSLLPGFTPSLEYEHSVVGIPCYDPLHAVQQVTPVTATADRTAGVLVAQGGHYNRAYRYDLTGTRTWTVQPGGDAQAIAIVDNTVYIAGHFICWSTDPRFALTRAACVAGESITAVPPPFEVQRIHLAAVSYVDGSLDMSWAPATEPFANAPYYDGTWALLVDSANQLWTGGVSRSLGTPDGRSDPDRIKLAVFPVLTDGTPPTGTFTPTACVVNTSCTFTAWPHLAPDATISSYAWNFGDGTTSGPTPSATVSHTFSSTGSFAQTVTFTDSTGAQGIAKSTVNIVQ